MEFYQRNRRWKLLLVLVAIIIGAASFIYTNWLARKMAEEEHRSVALWAEATRRLSSPIDTPDDNISFLSHIVESNSDIPIILTDSTLNILASANIDYTEARKAQNLQEELQKMISEKEPIEIILSETETQYIYYRDSKTLQNLKYFPLIQISVIALFIVVAYFIFNASRKAEQNQVWVGMSKETAHQLGTPISSLMAWIELLKTQDIDPELIREFEKDINRLEKITERFSKIGSKPELSTEDLRKTIVSTVTYLQRRTSQKVRFEMRFPDDKSFNTPHNPALISWVIENLCKNAIDAMSNAGNISLSLHDDDKYIYFDVSDNGKGIPKTQFKSIFTPGFTTKKRGWGLGLSLTKRIIEIYHQGKIFIKQSEIGKGTTFRIILRKPVFFNKNLKY
ncbi:PAS domain-containing sensor histidine kinase [Mangrovibacterium marinum]|uniref:histidine kinase n=1 Tax=Mangrovibacterium marinum TaxID=1639118 RepID=A0A2T5C6C4_9BACT|nr:HAMP domain-containing sensor histidine kinase [Mangrovibacterium marinum]PTN10505.1 histidine kinase/DNA gyrase B/HSP90-like ATPase [Mangrovibacterium marinum]